MMKKEYIIYILKIRKIMKTQYFTKVHLQVVKGGERENPCIIINFVKLISLFLTWLDEPCPAHLYLGWCKMKSPFDFDLQNKDYKNIFYEMTRFIIVIDDNRNWPLGTTNQLFLVSIRLEQKDTFLKDFFCFWYICILIRLYFINSIFTYQLSSQPHDVSHRFSSSLDILSSSICRKNKPRLFVICCLTKVFQ